ncbi:MAG TPA: helix-turn-helix transcriptional regulator, partial [Actinomycetes bacterium]
MDAPGQDRDERTAAAAARPLDLGTRLRAERLRQGMSLREMARRLGVSPSALSQIETGKAQPSVSKLFDIVNLLNTSLDGLLVGATRPPAGPAPAPEEAAPDALAAASERQAVPPDRAERLGRHLGIASRGPETEGFLSVQRDGEHEVLQLSSGVQWRRLTAGSLP